MIPEIRLSPKNYSNPKVLTGDKAMSRIELTYTQCKQIKQLEHENLRSIVERLQDQPEWLLELGGIDSFCTVQAVNQGGCASGAYMPAVTYWEASKLMSEWGDEVVEYIGWEIVDMPPIGGDSWGSYCCTLVSCAIELWCGQFEGLYDIDWD